MHQNKNNEVADGPQAFFDFFNSMKKAYPLKTMCFVRHVAFNKH